MYITLPVVWPNQYALLLMRLHVLIYSNQDSEVWAIKLNPKREGEWGLLKGFYSLSANPIFSALTKTIGFYITANIIKKIIPAMVWWNYFFYCFEDVIVYLFLSTSRALSLR